MEWNERTAVRTAWACWFLLFAISAFIIASGSARTVVPAYREGARYWMEGRTIFAHPGVGGFVYLPQAAVLFIPFALLPVKAGEVLWRLVNIGVFALGVFRFARMAGARWGREIFPLITLISLPLAWDCGRNGQATLVMTGCMLLATAHIAGGRTWRGAALLALAVSVKPLAVVLALLLMAIERPLAWRMPTALLAAAVFPFLTQHPAYVLDQYAAFWSSLTTAVHVGAVDTNWTTPFNALTAAGIVVPEKVQTVLRLAAAVATLALCALSWRRDDRVRSAVFVFSCAAAYLMLFSPRTENNTYALLGPAIAVYFAGAFGARRRPAEAAALGVMALAVLGGRSIERLLTPGAGASWMAPLMAACFAVYLIVQFVAGANREQPAVRTAAS